MSKPVDKATLESALAYGMIGVKLPSDRKKLTEEDRFALAKAIRAHLDLCRWEVVSNNEAIGPSSHGGFGIPGKTAG